MSTEHLGLSLAHTAPNADIHWPTGFTPADADLFAHSEIVIAAQPSTAWRHLVAATRWPEWYPNADGVRILNGADEELHEDSQFEFQTYGFHIHAAVGEFVPESRLGWFGAGVGIEAYHNWLLVSLDEGCRVVTEEVAKGPVAIAIREPDADAMHETHAAWSKALERLSASPVVGTPAGA